MVKKLNPSFLFCVKKSFNSLAGMMCNLEQYNWDMQNQENTVPAFHVSIRNIIGF